MSLNNRLDSALHEDMRTPLLPGETIITSYLASRFIGKQAVQCNTFLTSHRLVSEVSNKVLSINQAATIAGGTAGGAATTGAPGALMNAGATTLITEKMNSEVQGNRIIISLGDIQQMKPARYKLFGFIPTPGKGIAIADTRGKEYKIFFGMGGKRDEWTQAINSAKAANPTSDGSGWQEQI